MTTRKKVKDGLRRLSVREKSRNAQDVASWVGTTQPSRNNRDEAIPPAKRYSSQKSVDSESIELVEEPKKLDGGFGWVVVGFSFFSHFFADGFTFSCGIIFHAILENFGISRFMTSIIGSLFLALPLALSPFSNAIAQHLGNRWQLISGYGIAAFGISVGLLGLLIKQVIMFAVGFSFILPIGLSFIYNGAIVIVTLYFERKLGLATSLCVSGTGVGTMFFPQIIQKFEDFFPGESATCTFIFYLILTIFGFIIAFFFIRDVEWSSDGLDYKKQMFEKRVRQMLRERQNELEGYEVDDEYNLPRRSQSLPDIKKKLDEIRNNLIEVGAGSVKSVRESSIAAEVIRSRSVGHFMKKKLAIIPEYTMLTPGDFDRLGHLDLHLGHSPANTIHSKPAARNRMLSKTSMSVDAINAVGEDDNSHNRICFSDSEDDIDDTTTQSDSEFSNDGESSESELSDKVLTKKKLTANGNGISFALNGEVIPLIKTEPRVARQSLSAQMPAPGRVLLPRTNYNMYTNLLAKQGKMPSAPHICPPKKKWHEKSNFVRNTWNIQKSTAGEFPVYFRIIRGDVVCVLFLISVCLLYLVLDVAYMFFYDHAVENLKISREAASLLTTSLGFSSLISTWVFGYLADLKFFKNNLFIMNGVCMIMVGFALIGAGLATGFWSMWLASVVLGVFISSNYVLQSVLITKLYPNNSEFMPCYAMMCMFEGIFTIIGPPVVGFVRDITGEYSYTFFFAGIILGASGLFSILTHFGLKKNPRGESPSRPSPEDPLI